MENQTQEPQKEEPTAPKAQPRNVAKPTQQPKQAAPQPAAVAPKIKNRHDVAFRHDVFKSSEAECLVNTSYVHLMPKLERVTHMHIYHSHDSQGKKRHRTGSSNNHWHDVRHFVDPATGEILAQCGPPMHEVQFTGETGLTFSRIEQVSFEQELRSGPDAGKKTKHVDNHTHTMQYEGSEELSRNGITEDLKAQRAEASAMGINLSGGDVKDLTPPLMSPADGASIT